MPATRPAGPAQPCAPAPAPRRWSGPESAHRRSALHACGPQPAARPRAGAGPPLVRRQPRGGWGEGGGALACSAAVAGGAPTRDSDGRLELEPECDRGGRSAGADFWRFAQLPDLIRALGASSERGVCRRVGTLSLPGAAAPVVGRSEERCAAVRGPTGRCNWSNQATGQIRQLVKSTSPALSTLPRSRGPAHGLRTRHDGGAGIGGAQSVCP
jgi:hypothetical protein